MSIIGTITALFRLDTKEAETSAKRVSGVLGKELTGSLNNMSGSAGIAGRALSALGPAGIAVSATIGTVVASISYGVSALMEMGGRFTDLSRTTLISVEALQKLEAFGAPIGLSLETMTSASNKLTKSLGAGSAGTIDALKKLGLSMEALSGMTADQRLLTVSTALSSMTNPLEQSRTGVELLGKAWDAMKLSPESIEEGNAALANTVIVSAEAIAAGDALGDAWGLLWVNIKATAAEGAKGITGMLAGLVASTAEFIKQTNEGNELRAEATRISEERGGGSFGLAEITQADMDAAVKSLERRKELVAEIASEEAARAGYMLTVSERESKAAEKLAADQKKASEAAQKHSEEMVKVWAKLNSSAQDHVKFITQGASAFEDMATAAERTAAATRSTLPTDRNSPFFASHEVSKAGTTPPKFLGFDTKGMDFSGARELEARLKAEEAATEASAQFSQSLADAAHLLESFDGALGDFGTSLAQGSAAGSAMGKGLEEMRIKGHEMAGALELAAGAAAAFAAVMKATASGSTGSRIVGGAMAGGSAGSSLGSSIAGMAGIAGPIGSIVGAIGGAIIGGLVGFFRGRAITHLKEDIQRDIGVPISQGLAEAIKKSGLNAATFLDEIFGEAFAGGTGDVNRLAEEMGDLFSGIAQGALTAQEVKTELDQTLPMLLEHWDELDAVGLAAVDRLIDAMHQAGETSKELLMLERKRAGIIEATVEDLASLGITPEEAAALSAATGKGIQTEAQREATDLGVSNETLAAVAAAAGVEDVTKVSELLDSLGMTITELAAALNVVIPEGEGHPDPVSEAQVSTAENTKELTRLFGDFPRAVGIAVRDAFAAANG